MPEKDVAQKIIAQNKRARHEYHVLDTYEAGIALVGTEVKSLREGAIVLKDCYAEIRDGNIYLVGAHIAPYAQGNIYNHEPERRRRLLMHKREIVKLAQQVQEKGFTLIPLKVYFKQGKAKLELGLCRGKHTFDKREAIQDREVKRELDRAVKSTGRQ